VRTAIFGGTFDPVHAGHIAAALRAADGFSLDRVLFVVASQPPHKRHAEQADYEDRCRMVELACAEDERLEPSRLEAPSEGGPSYSIDTIERVRASLQPDDRLFFLIGEDAFADIETWHRADDVLEAVELIVIPRVAGNEVEDQTPSRARVRRLEGFEHLASSTEARNRVASGESLDGILPASVAAYIEKRGLYRAEDPKGQHTSQPSREASARGRSPIDKEPAS